jgi:hypothetical protein
MCRRVINHRDDADPRNNHITKRLLLIGFAACTFVLAPMLPASAMPIANPNTLAGDGSPIIQVHGWGHHHGWGHRHWGHHRGWGHHHHWV